MRVLFNICFALVSLVLYVYGEDITGQMQLMPRVFIIQFPSHGAQFIGILASPVKQGYKGTVKASVDDLDVLSNIAYRYPFKFKSERESSEATKITFTDLNGNIGMTVTVKYAPVDGDSIIGNGEFAPILF